MLFLHVSDSVLLLVLELQTTEEKTPKIASLGLITRGCKENRKSANHFRSGVTNLVSHRAARENENHIESKTDKCSNTVL